MGSKIKQNNFNLDTMNPKNKIINSNSTYNEMKTARVVYAEGGGIRCINNHRCCAERRLLSLLEHEAKNNGCKGSKIRNWIKKNTNGYIRIWRYTSDGNYGSAFPCSICRKTIEHYNLKVICTIGPDEWFTGYMTDENKSISKLTKGQMSCFSGESKYPLILKIHTP